MGLRHQVLDRKRSLPYDDGRVERFIFSADRKG